MGRIAASKEAHRTTGACSPTPSISACRSPRPEFAELAAFQAGGGEFSARRGESDRIAKPLRGEFVSGNYFSVFGVGAFAGRTIQPSDDQRSAPPVAMLSYRTWQQQYGSDPNIIGSNFILDGHPFTIIGITPPGFFGETLRSDPPDVWVPIQQEPLFRGNNSLLHAFSGMAARHRPPAARRIDRSVTGAMPARLTAEFANGSSMTAASPPSGWPASRPACPSRTSTSCPQAQASAS